MANSCAAMKLSICMGHVDTARQSDTTGMASGTAMDSGAGTSWERSATSPIPAFWCNMPESSSHHADKPVDFSRVLYTDPVGVAVGVESPAPSTLLVSSLSKHRATPHKLVFPPRPFYAASPPRPGCSMSSTLGPGDHLGLGDLFMAGYSSAMEGSDDVCPSPPRPVYSMTCTLGLGDVSPFPTRPKSPYTDNCMDGLLCLASAANELPADHFPVASLPQVDHPAINTDQKTSTDQQTSTLDSARPKKRPKRTNCTCQKSKCLKKYCSCFAEQRVCGSECACVDCDNKNISWPCKGACGGELSAKCKACLRVNGLYYRAMKKEMNLYVAPFHANNEDAPERVFTQIFDKKTNLVKYNTGCKCIQSKCIKLYCDCYRNVSFCGPMCFCKSCHNQRPEGPLGLPPVLQGDAACASLFD